MPTAYKTLGTLRSDLQKRIGFAAAGAAAGVNASTIDSFLYTAQTTLYWLHEWARLRRYEDKAVGADQYLIDYPTEANADRILQISIYDGNTYTPPIAKGISPQHYTTQSSKSRPSRWEPYAQIELWPKADRAYTARIWYVKELARFEQDNDRPDIYDTLVFLFALADAKDHYRQPDAKRYTEQRDALILKLKARARSQSVWNSGQEEEQLVRPVVI